MWKTAAASRLVIVAAGVWPLAGWRTGGPPTFSLAAGVQGGAAAQSSEVRGIVMNAATNQPLARALVQVDRQSMLTGHDGRFEFSGLGVPFVFAQVRKPGFYGTDDASQTATAMLPVGSGEDVTIRLTPEALITGTLTPSGGQGGGEGLPRIFVEALRLQQDEYGTQWTLGGQTSSNDDGGFRLTVPPGDYIVETQYATARTTGQPGGRDVVLPLLAGGGAGGAPVPMHVAAGTETRLDLRPALRPAHAVHIKLGNQTEGGRPQLQARMSNGMSFNLLSRPTEGADEMVAMLPRGTFTLIGQQVGPQTAEGASRYGETRVTVADHDVEGVLLNLTATPQIAVEVAVDPAITSDNAPTVQQLGLSLYRTDAAPSAMNQSVYLGQHRGATTVTATLMPGHYRLHAQGGGPWFVESAILGGTDLLTQDLVVEAGSSAEPLRLVVSNQTGTLRATAKLGGTPGTCWVYLIATSPAAAPVLSAMTGPDGSLTRGFVPPGSYRVVASERRLSGRLTDSAVQAKFAPYVQTVTVAAGDTVSVDLAAIPASEMKP